MGKSKSIMKILKIAGIAAGVLYLLACLCLYTFQNKILYYPQELSIIRMVEIDKTGADIEEETIRAEDGIDLKGWVVNKNNKNAVYYFGGNAEEVSDMIEQVQDIKNCAFVLINYRGYGESGGKPSEKSLFSDAATIYDYFQKKYNYSNTIIMGRSLGSGIALNLASQRDAKGLVLVTPYDNMTNIAKEKVPPVFPVNLLLHERYESDKIAGQIKIPTLVITAQYDNVVPRENTENLTKHFKNQVQAVEIPETGHNSISQTDEYWDAINQFFIKVQS